MNKLKIAIKRRQRRNISKILSPKHIWLWSGCIEEVILHSSEARNEAERVLRDLGASLPEIFADGSARRKRLVSLLHGSAHEPNLIRGTVEGLWRAKQFERSEIKSAINFTLGKG